MIRFLLSLNFWSVLLALAYTPASAHASDVDYLRDVKPLLSQHCYACHGALKQEGGLRLDTAKLAGRGGDSGSATSAPGEEDSLLIKQVMHSDPSERMPPDVKPLSAEQIEVLKKWIKGGAAGPADEQPQKDPLQHWAFQPPQPRLPDVHENPLAPSSTSINPVDAWLNAKTTALAIQPLGQATKRELIRRVTLDLIGLPPTLEQIHAFEADTSPQAYERLVEELLARPEYGERWGRHWMDVWRYSDWYGRRSVPDVMNSYPQIWRWRDWIVRSLNEDKGYDRMLMEMVAADELCPTDDANIVATGFVVRNWYKWNYETWMKDCVEHTGKAFLGLTLNCAQCHDHKFDPITQEDYFRFRAFFEPLELRHERVSGEPDPGPFKKYVYAQSYGPIKSGAIRIFDEKLDAKTYMFRGGDARNRIEGKPPVECGPPKAFTHSDFAIQSIELPPNAYFPGLKSFVRDEELKAVTTDCNSAADKLAAAEKRYAEATDKALADSSKLPASNDKPDVDLAQGQLQKDDAEMQLRVARAAHQAAAARRDSLLKRIAADDASVAQSKNADELARLAHMSESSAGYLSAEHARLVAEQSLIAAERQLAAATAVEQPADKPTKKADAEKSVEAATKKLDAARVAMEAARKKLAQVDATYTPLSPKYPQQSTGRRTALAKWLVDRRNPLTARVAVNHIWMRHFGTPLVESVDNFGMQGKLPKHPELLDWLAVYLMDNQWSMKSLHRLILTSQAYQRSSSSGKSHEPGMEKDRDNETYWHFPIRRMEAEVVRDSVLACSGVLDSTMGGPEIEVDQWIKRPRRSMYFTQHGESQMLFLSTFDGANPCECYRRSSTVLPSQALALTNSELLVHYGRITAGNLQRRIVPETSSANAPGIVAGSSKELDASTKLVDMSSNSEFVRLAFESLLGRLPSDDELKVSLKFLSSSQDLVAGGAGEAGASKPAEGIQPASTDPALRAKENLVMALFNHSDFVSIR